MRPRTFNRHATPWIAGGLFCLALAVPAQSQQDAPTSFANLADRLSPAVVNISTATKVTSEMTPDFPMPDLPPGSPFEEFFKRFFDERMREGPRKVTSLGSGFIIDPSGVIVTNNHVIDAADEITVTLVGGKELKAELVGHDEKTDLAVLHVESDEPLPALKWGDSNALRVGDWVLAIGNPFGLGGTVTAGIVSARNRNINAGPYDDFLQTDAAINRGNSGGPLFNLAGEVVGVNTAIISPTGGSIGIGFAIPSEIAKGVVFQLREFGETRRGWLGVRIQSLTPDIAESLDLKSSEGALVVGVDDDGPAKRAGIEMGDVIVSFDGKPVPAMRDLPRIVAETEIGTTADVEVIRNGKRRTFTVEIARLLEAAVSQENDESGTTSGKSQPGSKAPIIGLTLSKLTGDLRTLYDIDEDIEGVVVTAVDPDSDAYEKIQEGDVIVEIGQMPVKTPDEAIERIKELTDANPNKPVLLLIVNRSGENTFRSVRPKTPT